MLFKDFLVTTYTTIGYGNVTAKTRLGQMAAMLYAVIGIPLVLMILHKAFCSFSVHYAILKRTMNATNVHNCLEEITLTQFSSIFVE